MSKLGVDLVQGFYLARPGWPWPEIRPLKVASGAGEALPEWADPLVRPRLASAPDDGRTLATG